MHKRDKALQILVNIVVPVQARGVQPPGKELQGASTRRALALAWDQRRIKVFPARA
jgi:hypothetical protein